MIPIINTVAMRKYTTVRNPVYVSFNNRCLSTHCVMVNNAQCMVIITNEFFPQYTRGREIPLIVSMDRKNSITPIPERMLYNINTAVYGIKKWKGLLFARKNANNNAVSPLINNLDLWPLNNFRPQ